MKEMFSEENFEQEKIKEFDNWEQIPNNPKEEGLRLGNRYCGGDPNEIIIVAGKRYRKEIIMEAEKKNEAGIGDAYTEAQYFSHETDGVGPGPGWDSRMVYTSQTWPEAGWLEPADLADLPYYQLVEDREQID